MYFQSRKQQENFGFHHLFKYRKESLFINFVMYSKKMKHDDSSFEAQPQSSQSVVCNYNVITYRDRIRLIEMVCLERVQITEAAGHLGIKISTAKYILRCFRKNNKVLLKNEGPQLEKQKFEEEIRELKRKIEEQNKKRIKSKVKGMKKNIKIWSKEEKAQVTQVRDQELKQDKKQNIENQVCLPNSEDFRNHIEAQKCLFYYMFYNPYWPNLPI